MSRYFRIKPDRPKFDPKTPERVPGFKEQREKAQRLGLYDRMVKGMTPGQKAEYDKGLRGNPNNIPGAPNFHPPLPEASLSLAGVRQATECRVSGCGGCCIAADNYVCPRCGTNNQPMEER